VETAAPFVLVVEDNHLLGELVCTALRRSGLEALHVVSPFDAIRYLEHARPTLIIVDYYMPDLNGVQLMVHLQHQTELKNTPVIGLSSDARTAREFMRFGAKSFIAKPFNEAELITTVRQFLPEQKESASG
jgi:CheY-like chemotaxis protein